MTPRQMQVAYLAQHGASNKEIARVLGIEEATVKTYKKQLREICKDLNRDVFGVPINNPERMAALHGLNRVFTAKMRFGNACD